MAEFDSWKLESGCTDDCAVHKTSLLNFYCPKHSVFACGNCLVEFHSDCETEFVPEAARKYINSEEIKNLSEKLTDFEKELLSVKNDPNEKAICDIRKFRTELNDYLDKKEMELVTKVKQLQEESNSHIINKEESSAEYESIKADFEELKTTLSESLEQSVQFYMMSKRETTPIQMLKNLQTRFRSWTDRNKTPSLVFRLNSDFENIMKSDESLGTLLDSNDCENGHGSTTLIAEDHLCTGDESDGGNINEDSNNETLSATGYQMTENENGTSVDSANQSTLVDISTLVGADLYKQDDINVRCTEDRRDNCGITGLDLLSSELLILADKEEAAVKLCEVQNTRQVISRLSLPYAPFGVAAVSAHEAVVTIPFEKVIHFISVIQDNMLIIGDMLKVGDACYGVAYHRGKLVVSFCSPAKIQIMDLHGQVFKTIATNWSGSRFFEWPRYVTVTDDGIVNGEVVGTIYVSDEFKKTITKLSKEGDVRFSHTEENKDNVLIPRGIASFGNDHILICYSYSGLNEIHIMSKRGKSERLLMRNHVRGKTPQAIKFCPLKKRVYISCCGYSFANKESYNRVEVYGF